MTIAQEHEIARLEKELAEYRARNVLEPFVARLLEDIGTNLTYTPYDKWPTIAKLSLAHCKATGFSISAAVYLSRLPKGE